MASYLTNEYPISLSYDQKLMLEVMLINEMTKTKDEDRRLSIKDLLSKISKSFLENCTK